MQKPKLRVLVINRPLYIGEHPVTNIFTPYKNDYDAVVFPTKEGVCFTQLIILNTALMGALDWAQMFYVICDCDEAGKFYDFDLYNLHEERVYDILNQKFEVITTNITEAEKSHPFPVESKNYHGFLFFGSDLKCQLVRTFIPIEQVTLSEILAMAKLAAQFIEFKVLFGTIRELTIVSNDIKVNSVSKKGTEKFQSFIFKRNGNKITDDDKIYYFVDGKKLELNFSQYDVTIVEID